MNAKRNVYAIYSSQDLNVLQHLLFHLRPLEDDLNISIWHDDAILPNQAWIPQNPSKLNEADIFLLLVSDAFMHSEFIQQIEFKNVIDRYKADKAKVIPILIDNCPWDTEFNSDEYDFSFKELQVLPKDKKPISDWDSEDEAMEHVTEHLKKAISLKTEPINNRDTKSTEKKEESVSLEENTLQSQKEEQVVLSFNEDSEANQITEAAKKQNDKGEIEKEVAAKKKAQELADAKKRAEEARIAKEKAELDKQAEEKKLQEELEARKKAELEQLRRKEAHAKKWAEEDSKEVHPVVDAEQNNEEDQKGNEKLKNRVLLGILAAFVLLGIWFFTDRDQTSEKSEETLPNVEVTQEKEPESSDESKKDDDSEVIAAGNLVVGDSYEGGIVFRMNEAGNPSKVAATKDAGPMTWNQAVKAAEQIGEGWRLPTLAELRTMYRTIGPGATNSGEFTDELYWSGTPFDENQARLLRFKDGNSSFHYNSRGTHRKFLFRAVKDFN